MRIPRLLVIATVLAAASLSGAAQTNTQFLPLTPMDRIEIQQLIARYA